MKKILFTVFFIFGGFVLCLAQNQDSTKVYKKKVLENAEVDFLMSLYQQEGDHSAVGGGVGTEELTDGTPTIVISLPLNDDDVLTIDAGISAYTSASSSNINPFNSSGASRGGEDDDDDEHEEEEDDFRPGTSGTPTGTPWLASSGASRSDELISLHVDYSHSSDSRNFIWGSNVSFSNEYDYTSVGFGGNITGLFNEKNTELGLKGTVYLDQWKPIYPTELHEYAIYGNNFLNQGYFSGVDVISQNGTISANYHPDDFTAFTNKERNSYSVSFFLSQILSKRLQAALFFDLVKQEGLLSTPYHRIYFADKANYYIGEANYIPVYTTPQNRGVYQLADDIERLPSTRFKIPIGARVNYYINETFVLRTYYRYYTDDWGLEAHTANIDLPVRFGPKFSITPSYRFYTQNAVKYYAPYETHLSTEQYYTSDPDLAKFNSNQYSVALNYNDIFNDFKISRLGLKNANIKFSHYERSDGLRANIVSVGFKFIFK
ncbi:DUF3570 domain-containing protein [Maribellus comscasis]|uniref:DUF3570 domain-containing protein n=1 Tax=Maribellus comscasis TaxID=2681766 RepID=A0A6I6JMR9_9BACT|nr:DUF3570 domain-containing protein [Maribellus comscasis]QGY44205.1 DUF3570 domain-containing protein [Maribellus comscasis]